MLQEPGFHERNCTRCPWSQTGDFRQPQPVGEHCFPRQRGVECESRSIGKNHDDTRLIAIFRSAIHCHDREFQHMRAPTSLYQQSQHFLRWLQRIVVTFLRLRFVGTLGTIVGMGIARVTSLLAFFLPIKILLLAAYPGIPHYFQGFVEPDTKAAWILFLAGGAILLYAFNFLLDSQTRRYAEIAGPHVLSRANQLRLSGRDYKSSGEYFGRICKLTADGLFIFVGFLAGLLIYPEAFTFLALLTLVAYTASAWLMSRPEPGPWPAIRRFMENRTAPFLKLLSAVLFLAVFFLVLGQYLQNGSRNLLIAILAILIIRQILAAMEQSLREAIRLWPERVRIDAIVLPEAQMNTVDSSREQQMRSLFQREARNRLVQETMQSRLADRPAEKVKTCWLDSPLSGIVTCGIVTQPASEGNDTCHYQLQAFPPERVHRLENELFLLSRISPEALRAAPTLIRFHAESFQCRIIEAGRGFRLNSEQWSHWYPRLLLEHWSLTPPESLIEAYALSRPLPHQRFTPEFCESLTPGIDNDRDDRLTRWLIRNVDRVAENLAGHPLAIHNPELSRDLTVATTDDAVLIISWGRWELVPLGAHWPSQLMGDEQPKAIAVLSHSRTDSHEPITPAMLRHGAACRRFIQHVEERRLKAALEQLAGIRHHLERRGNQGKHV